MSTLSAQHPPLPQPPSALPDPAPAPALQPEKIARRGLWILDALFLAISITGVLLAPGGGWLNYSMNVSLWWNGDPGSGYLVSSLYLFTPDRHSFVGHPGLPLQIIVGILAKLIYLVHHLGGGQETIYHFWARNIHGLFILGGLTIVIIHVVSFHVIYAFARRLVSDPRAALLAVIAYATSFPLLYYSTRLSPEPILVITFALTIMFLWNMRAQMDAGNRRLACRWAALAGFTSIAAIYNKIHLSTALPVMATLQLLLQTGASPQRLLQRIRTRLFLLGVFLLSAIATALIGLVKVDWPWFFNWWQRYAPGTYHAQGPPSVPLGGPIRGFFINMRQNLLAFLPQMNRQGLFAITEGIFVIAALVALIWYLRKERDKRPLFLWPLLYCLLITPVILYRGLWHYTFLHLVVGAIPLAMMLWELTGRFVPRARFTISMALLLLIHSASFVFFISGRRYDINRYRTTVRGYHLALAQIKPDERIAAVVPRGIPPRLLYGYWPDWISGGAEFKQALDDMVIQVNSPQKLTDQFVKEKKIVAVVARKAGLTRVWPAGKIKSLPTTKESGREPQEKEDMRDERP